MLSVLHLLYNQVISSAERAVLMSWALGLDTSSQLCRWEWWKWWDCEMVRMVIWWDGEKQCKWHLETGWVHHRISLGPRLSSWQLLAFSMQVKLEDVFPMVASHHMGSPFSHSAHIYQSRWVHNFITFERSSWTPLKTGLFLNVDVTDSPFLLGWVNHIRLNYILGYHTTYVCTPQALQLRDETMAILRMAVEHWLQILSMASEPRII